MTTASALLRSVAPLPYPQRMRELALFAWRGAADPEFTALLAELSAQGRYERRTALHLAMAARDLGFVAAVLRGPDLDLRRAALRAVRTLPVPDDDVARVLDDAAPRELRRALYATLRHSRRDALADRLLPRVRERWGEAEAAALLPACRPQTVDRLLPELAHAVVAWRALSVRHPLAVLDDARREFTDGRGHGWTRRRGSGFEHVAAAAPGAVFALLEELGPEPAPRLLFEQAARPLYRADPGRAFGLWRACTARYWRGGGHPPRSAVRALTDADLAYYAGRVHDGAAARLLTQLPPGRRTAVYDEMMRDTPVERVLRRLPFLGLIAPARAAEEARRMLAWHAGAWHSSRSRLDDPDLPLRLTAQLPYAEAAPVLAEAATGGDPRRRGLARRLLLRCAEQAGDRAVLADVVAGLAARTAAERDPLRQEALVALGTLRVGSYDASLAGSFERFATAVVDARDTSPATWAALRTLADRVLRHHDGPALTAWALDTYGRLVARFGVQVFLRAGGQAPARAPRRRRQRRPDGLGWHRLDLVLRPGQEAALLDSLRPALDAERARGTHLLPVGLAQSLGRRAYALPGLQESLGVACAEGSAPLVAEAVRRWLADPRNREERAVALLDRDAEAVSSPIVERVLLARRTDLIATVLDGNAEWAPAVGDFAGRWTPGQAERVRLRLAERAADAGAGVDVRIGAVASVGRGGPAFGREGADWLHSMTGGTEHVFAEAAVEALCRRGGARTLDAVPALAGGPLAAAVVASLGRACAQVPDDRLLPVLERLLTADGVKLTVRKAAARQLARTGRAEATGFLLERLRSPGTHRDLRAALAQALAGRVEDPRVLPVLAEAADGDSDETFARTLFALQPYACPPGRRAGYADLVLRLLLTADGPGVRFRGGRAFRTWAVHYGGEVTGVVESFCTRWESDGAAEAVLALAGSGVIRDQVPYLVDRLTAAEAAGTGAVELTPVPSKRLDGLTSAVGTAAKTGEAWAADLAERVRDRLAACPGQLHRATRLRLQMLDPEDAERFAAALLECAESLRDHPVLAARAAESLRREHGRYGGGTTAPPESLEAAAAALLPRTDLAAAGHLALAVVRMGGPEADWPPQWLERLDALRRWPDEDVRYEAAE
ncbi:hypothetical protein AB0M28_38875 [Streptomyces sp. NPDC051940]|uniref:hypothetical protein n=1 Tax=Streptomyces sp. NPDC051940 TaxID=3155675 RepID=UPI0034249CE5